jgi:hypothetical protein
MTLLVVLLILLVVALVGPMFGADTRSAGGWSSTDADRPLWADAGRRAH